MDTSKLFFSSRLAAKVADEKYYFTGKPCLHGHLTVRIAASSNCVECQSQSGASAKRREYRRDYYRRTSEKAKADAASWGRLNPEARKESRDRYKKTEAGKRSSIRYKQGRRAAHRNARPKWRDQCVIDSIYEEAKLVGMTVDHVIPLVHPLVCGLHVENNMMIVSVRANQAKGNRFTVK